MKASFVTLTAILGLASAASLPTCVVKCVTTHLKGAGCSSITDLSCLCDSIDKIYSESESCLKSSCSSKDLIAGKAVVSKTCGKSIGSGSSSSASGSSGGSSSATSASSGSGGSAATATSSGDSSSSTGGSDSSSTGSGSSASSTGGASSTSGSGGSSGSSSTGSSSDSQSTGSSGSGGDSPADKPGVGAAVAFAALLAAL